MKRNPGIKSYYPLFYFLGIIGAIVFAGCHSDSSQKRKDNSSEKRTAAYYKYFQGTSGSQKVILQLISFNQQFEGIFINDSISKPLEVTGKKDSAGQLVLVTYDRYNPVDTFKGTFPQPGVFQGIDIDTSGNQRNFTLQEIYPPGTYHWDVFTMSDSVAFDSAQSHSPQARVQIMLLWPARKGIISFQEKMLTDSITKYFCGMDTALKDPESVLKNPADSFFTQYKRFRNSLKGSDDEKREATFNWDSDLKMELLWNADSIVSIAFQSYQYTGGAHGLSNTLLKVFDLRTNHIVQMNDVFKPGYENELRDALEQILREQYNIPAGSPLNGNHGILFDKHLALTKNFYLTGKGIGFIYNPYEVAPYYVGQIELYIPFDRIKNIIQPFYLLK